MAVLGIAAAYEYDSQHTTLIDKDFMAVEYARRNCEKNGLTMSTRIYQASASITSQKLRLQLGHVRLTWDGKGGITCTFRCSCGCEKTDAFMSRRLTDCASL
jgi:hypothetical protein